MNEMDFETDTEQTPVTELTAAQRRVLGVLVEKAFTTPEYYPLTLKALTAGCNQKSNRSPVCSYSEDGVLDVLEGLRKLGLAAVVYTETGRTERYRHYMRQRFPFSEPPTLETSGAPTAELAERLQAMETMTTQHSVEFQSVREELEHLKNAVRQLGDQFEDLRRDLGG